jgi:hypothetical protein
LSKELSSELTAIALKKQLERQRYSVGQQLRGLLNLIAEKSAAEMMNQQVYLSSSIVNE